MSKQALARIFVPLTKVDEEQRLVYGTISHEVLDKSGEVMDYETSKPLFEKWSEGISEATGGLSKGNVRVMHGMTAAGKLTELNFDDDNKSIDVCAKIVDDNEWQKVTEGVYTGFSVGGKYAKKWSVKEGDTTVKKYTAQPMEVSIVDNPCVPSATFSMFKADGSEVEVPFQVEHDADEWPLVKADGGGDAGDDKETPGETEVEKEEPSPKADIRAITEGAQHPAPEALPDGSQPKNEDVAKKAVELAIADGKTDADWAGYVEPARADLIKAAHNPLNEDPQADIPNPPKVKAPDKTKTLEGEGVDDNPGIKSTPKEIQQNSQKTTPAGIRQLWTASDGQGFEKKADCEAHEAELLAKAGGEGDEQPEEEEGAEEKGKELPLADQLKAALATVGEALAKAETVLTEDKEDEVPLFADFDRLSKAVAFIEEDADEVLQKSVYTVSRFAEVLSSMANLVSSVKCHSEEDSGLPDDIKAAVTALSATFQTFATEQVAKLVANLNDPKSCDYYYCAAKEEGADALAKDVAAVIEAVAEPADLIKAAVAAAIKPEDTDEGGDDGEGEDMAKVVGERDELRKAVAEALPMITELQKRIQVIEETPLPRAPRNIVEKDGGNGLLKGTTDTERLAEVAELVKLHGADGLATMMIKASQATGGQRLNPVG